MNVILPLLPLALVVLFALVTPAGAVLPNQDWGTYPACIAPAIPIETEGWWDEKASPLPSDNLPGVPDAQRLISKLRHVHVGVCMPASRTMDGSDGLVLKGVYDFVAVFTLHNHPGAVAFVTTTLSEADETVIFQKKCPDVAGCNAVPWATGATHECVGGRIGCVRFLSRPTCPTGTTCVFAVNMRLNIGARKYSGLNEMRTMANITGVAPRNDRQYADNHFQIHLGGALNYRKTPAPRGRGWYQELQYASVYMANYMDFFKGRTDITIPVVSGTIPLQVVHQPDGTGTTRSRLVIDADGHHDVPGIIVYDESGLKHGTVMLDTRTLSNGVHKLRMNTEESNEFGRNFGVIKYYINVQN
jgi:hypothetical protein